MRDDLEFRLAAAALFLAMTAARLYFLRGTDRAGDRKELKKRPLDHFILVFFGSLWLISLAVYVVFPAWLKCAALATPPWARWTGAAFGCAMLALFIWAHAAIGKFFSFFMRTIEGHKLITTGPFLPRLR
jgi:protein-S-isoprenylcysteine O-methyltransferase Ste14